MFGTIRKHQTWLWAVIISITIITFVIFFSPYSKMNTGSRRSGSYGSINGQVVTDQMYIDAYREADLHSLFMTGRWWSEDKKRSDSDLQREIYQWLLLSQKQNDYGIHVDDETAAEMARQMVRSFERMGITSPQMFIQKVLLPHGLQVADFERYIQHFVGIQELINTVGLGGRLITPQEARLLYERDHQEVATAAVPFSVSNYLASVPATPEAVGQFYTNRQVNYVIPERVSVSYVRFSVSNFLAQAEADLSTNLTELVEGYYQRSGTNLAALFPDTKSPEEVKKKIRERLIHQQAMLQADKKANEFNRTLANLQPEQPENLASLALTNGLSPGVTAPFDRDDGPKDLEVGPDFTKRAFELSADLPFCQPIAGRDGVYVIAFNQRLPRETPPLDKIRDQVVADYKRNQAIMMAQEAARSFYLTLTNGIAQGKTFSNLCAEAHLKPIELPPFSISTRSLPEAENLASLNQLKQAAFTTAVGKPSRPVPTAEGSLILFVQAKLPLDPAKMQADLPTYLATVRRGRQQEAFDEWFRREAQKGLSATPLALPKPSSLGSGDKS